MKKNIDIKTVEGFGDEWHRYDQSKLINSEYDELFNRYFKIFPWEQLPVNATGFDLGCGSGRWAKGVAGRVGKIHCIDPSSAVEIAKKNLLNYNNCVFHNNSVEEIPLEDFSMDFGYSLGVLHHIPNTKNALSLCVSKLKNGAPFLLYLYYSFDNRPKWYYWLWKASDLIRLFISKLPHNLRSFTCLQIALFVYYPLAKISRILELSGLNTPNLPLYEYRNLSLYTMKTDALDRFGTRLEQRFSKKEIKSMMEESGLERIQFSNESPFWCALGFKK